MYKITDAMEASDVLFQILVMNGEIASEVAKNPNLDFVKKKGK